MTSFSRRGGGNWGLKVARALLPVRFADKEHRQEWRKLNARHPQRQACLCHSVGDSLLRSFLAGANLLPAARTLVGLQNFFAKANRLRRDFDEFIVSNEFDRLFEAELT